MKKLIGFLLMFSFSAFAYDPSIEVLNYACSVKTITESGKSIGGILNQNVTVSLTGYHVSANKPGQYHSAESFMNLGNRSFVGRTRGAEIKVLGKTKYVWELSVERPSKNSIYFLQGNESLSGRQPLKVYLGSNATKLFDLDCYRN